jgi:hypothetical protein
VAKIKIYKKVHSCCKDVHVHTGFLSYFENEKIWASDVANSSCEFLHARLKTHSYYQVSSFGNSHFNFYPDGFLAKKRSRTPKFIFIRVLRL